MEVQMSEKFFDNSDDFVALFDFDSSDCYTQTTPLIDQKIGFSVQRQYPANIAFKPAHNKLGEPDDVAVIWVVYEHPDETGGNEEPHNVPIYARVAKVSRFLQNHLDYDFAKDESPTKDELHKSSDTPKPIDLVFSRAYFLDHRSGVFYDEGHDAISGLELLEQVFEKHCRTVHPTKGLKLRSKIRGQRMVLAAMNNMVSGLIWILRNAFGRSLTEPRDRVGRWSGYPKESFKKLSTDSFNVGGYQTTKRSVLTFALFIVLVDILSRTVTGESFWSNFVTNNKILWFAYPIVGIWLFDTAIPVVLFRLLNALIAKHMQVVHMSFKAF